MWYAINYIVFNSAFFPFNGFKSFLLRLFGAKIGRNNTIKPRVIIKFPWKLSTGDNVWIGEGVLIDNLAQVNVGNNVCISQNALLETGNHNYKRENFELITSPVTIEDESWIAASSVVCPGTTIKRGTVICAGTVISGITQEAGIYCGNPAKKIKNRIVEE